MSSTPEPTAAITFDEAFRRVAEVQGWMTRAQAGRLWDRASTLVAGDQVVEIGSFHGRSAIMLASAAADGVAITAIDPHGGNDRGPQEIEGFEDEAARDHEQFWENLRAAGVDRRITHVRQFSQKALDEVDGDVALLYIDGAHRFAPARADIRRWGRRVSPGGTMLIHDSFSSVGVTLALIAELFTSSDFTYVGRSGSMAEYRRVKPRGSAKLVSAFHQVTELAWFARNLLVKTLIVARLGRLTRLLGSDGTWPY